MSTLRQCAYWWAGRTDARVDSLLLRFLRRDRESLALSHTRDRAFEQDYWFRNQWHRRMPINRGTRWDNWSRDQLRGANVERPSACGTAERLRRVYRPNKICTPGPIGHCAK